MHSMAASMTEYIKQRAKAARWLLDNKDRAAWWDWPVLTCANPDSSNPGIPEVTAFNIFTDLAERKLLVPYTINSADEEGKQRGVYKLHLGNEAGWRDVTHPPGWLRRGFNWVSSKWAWLLATVISALIGAYVKSLFDSK
jgi:hypothetical protein